MEPLLWPADILRAVVLPAVRAGTVTHGLIGTGSLHHGGGSAAQSQDGGSADLRLALQLGLDALPAVVNGHSTGPKRSSMASGSISRRSHSSLIARRLVWDGTASELLRALCALLDSRPTAQPSRRPTAADEHAGASCSSPPGEKILLRVVEPALELLQRLVAAIADLTHEVCEGQRSAETVREQNPSDPDLAVASPAQLSHQLEELLAIARCCSWRTALHLAPLGAAMSLLPACAAATASELAEPADSAADFAALLVPPVSRSSNRMAQTAEQTQHRSDSRLMSADSVRTQQAVTECLVLCASSADAASAFAEAAHALTAPQQTAALEISQQNVSTSGGQITIQGNTTALAVLVLQLPRKHARRTLLATCLELLPWCTAAEYRRLTETVLPAWLAALQPRSASAAATPGSTTRAGFVSIPGGSPAASVHDEAAPGNGGEAATTGVLQLCARAASLLVRDDAPVAEGGSGRRDTP